MEFLKKENPQNTQKSEKESEYNFEKQKNMAIEQFEKIYAKNKSTKAEKKPEKIKVKFKKSNIPNFMDILFKDQDKTLIILLIVMLMENEENLMIIMALLYLIV